MDFVHAITGISLDIVILAAAFLILAAYGFYFGKGRLLAFITGFYAASLLYINFPYRESFIFWKGTTQQVALSRALIFLVFFVIANYIFIKFMHGDFSFSKTSRLFEIGILSLSGTILVMVFVHHIVPLDTVHTFSSGISGLFASKTALFWWFLTPLVGILIGNRYG